MGADQMRYTAEAGSAIVEAIGSHLVKQTVRLVWPDIGAVPGVGSLVTEAIESFEVVDAADLVDTATAHTLGTLGDAHTLEATKILREAKAERRQSGKNQLRTRAATLLHSAYSEYATAIDVKMEQIGARPEWTGTVRRLLFENLSAASRPDVLFDELIELHDKAASRALAIAVINRHMNLPQAASGRADEAYGHWAQQFVFRFMRAAGTIEQVLRLAENRRLGGVPASRVTELGLPEDPLAAIAATSALIRIADQHIAATHNWDGRGRNLRLKTANFFLEVTGEHRGRRIEVHKANLARTQSAADDLKDNLAGTIAFSDLYQVLMHGPKGRSWISRWRRRRDS
jgi:hypothetical protein